MAMICLLWFLHLATSFFLLSGEKEGKVFGKALLRPAIIVWTVDNDDEDK